MQYEPGQLILNGKYRIEAFIGQGAFAEVYRATHIDLQQQRALKLLHHDMPGVGSSYMRRYAHRFQLEAQIGAGEAHPNVIQVFDFEHEGELLVLVMEYAAGGSLKDRLLQLHRAGSQMPVDEVVKVALDLANGLGVLHERAIVHRDIKPSNILFDAHRRAKVADLGLAQTNDDMTMRLDLGSDAPPHPGTPAYMSPEQATTTQYLRHPSDVYALGLVIFEALTGQNYQDLRRNTHARELRVDAPEWLDRLLVRMLVVNPDDRPFDGAEVAKLLREGQAKGATLRALNRHYQELSTSLNASLEAQRKASQDAKRRDKLERARQIEDALIKAEADRLAILEAKRKSDLEKEQLAEETRRQADAKRQAKQEAERKSDAYKARLIDEARLKAEADHAAKVEAKRKQEAEKERRTEETRQQAEAKRRADESAKQNSEREKARRIEEARLKAEEDRKFKQEAERLHKQKKAERDEAYRKKRAADLIARREARQKAYEAWRAVTIRRLQKLITPPVLWFPLAILLIASVAVFALLFNSRSVPAPQSTISPTVNVIPKTSVPDNSTRSPEPSTAPTPMRRPKPAKQPTPPDPGMPVDTPIPPTIDSPLSSTLPTPVDTCVHKWFFRPWPVDLDCPSSVISVPAVIQRYDNGLALWLNNADHSGEVFVFFTTGKWKAVKGTLESIDNAPERELELGQFRGGRESYTACLAGLAVRDGSVAFVNDASENVLRWSTSTTPTQDHSWRYLQPVQILGCTK